MMPRSPNARPVGTADPCPLRRGRRNDAKRQALDLKERSAPQEHFIDLFRLLGDRRDLSLVKARVERPCGRPWAMFMPWIGSGTLAPPPHGHRGFTVQSPD